MSEVFALSTKLNEVQSEIKELELVLSTLKEADESRKCFRMVGGVLVERTVKEVTGALEQSKTAMVAASEQLTKQRDELLAKDNKAATATA
ncbi:prefoldin subunit 2 [Gregarina niphandrodes]|uniref:Prefoldin subunit 2 n=1 Tax=Gregarina niphandrodes TaxID=110365 RepID=A0A023B4H6_GRENI|nr:prefoldin subunit 2 [Gregarina niphandrodes]EZG56394.1 prefoldin subunit 2 [Gregarina niphandrodes]|eukprot:XP_011131267.1 prefoldin subunit 2 [Gregarina niphandrodes]